MEHDYWGGQAPLLVHWGGQWPPQPPWFLLQSGADAAASVIVVNGGCK